MLNCANLLDLYHSIDILVTNCCCPIVADLQMLNCANLLNLYHSIDILVTNCCCSIVADAELLGTAPTQNCLNLKRSVYIFLEFTELVYLLYINSKTANTEEHRYFSNFVEINDKEYCDHTVHKLFA